MCKQFIINNIEEKSNIYKKLSDEIWAFAETRFEEFQSSERMIKVLEEENFKVEKNIANITTAFVASYGEGSPVISILAEYDALSGLSQKSGIATKEVIKEGGSGHGCGHHLLGVGSISAAVAVKDYLKENKLNGTIRLYGCPGEEGGSGKVYMVRDGVFDDVDVALCWHPFAQNAIFSLTSLANYQVYFRFHGKSSHAAACPHLGRSALDAVELMNVGVNYLREHIIPEARVHYATTNSGGNAPNVVQSEAEVLYLIRAPRVTQVEEIYQRICDIAKGAALMTQTKSEIIFDKGCSNLVLNNTLEELLYKNYREIGVPKYNDKDIEFAKEIRKSLSETELKNEYDTIKMLAKEQSNDIINKMKDDILSNIIIPFKHHAGILPGSTDVSDVSWVVPTAQIMTSCFALGTPGHSWQTVAQGTSDYAHKGMLTAGKVLAMTAIDIFKNPEIIYTAKNELVEKLGGEQYKSPIPEGIEPSVLK